MQKSSTRLKGLLTGALALGAVATSAFPAAAQNTQSFAGFTQQDVSRPFTFTNNAAASTFTFNAASTQPVIFSLFGISTSQANVSLSSTASTPAIQGINSIQQNLENVVLSFRRVSDNANLLTVTGTGFIRGGNGDLTASFQGDTADGDVVNFSSDFVTFDTSTQRNFSIGLTSVTPMVGVNANGFLNSFTATGAGTFATNVTTNVIPEPGAVVGMTLLGSGLCGLMVRARRRTARKA